MVGYEIHEFGWSYLSFCGCEMAKSVISRQNRHIGTGTKSGYWYHTTEGNW